MRRKGRRADADAVGRNYQGLELPEQLEHVWRWWVELHNANPGGGVGPAFIAFSEIKAWSELTGVRPRWWEVELIQRLAAIYRQVTR